MNADELQILHRRLDRLARALDERTDERGGFGDLADEAAEIASDVRQAWVSAVRKEVA